MVPRNVVYLHGLLNILFHFFSYRRHYPLLTAGGFTWFSVRCEVMFRERQSGSETRERLRCNNTQGVCQRPCRDADILNATFGEGRQDSCRFLSLLIPSSSSHLIVRSDRTPCITKCLYWLAPLCLLRPLSQRALQAQSYLWPPGTSLPFGTSPQSFHAFSNVTAALGAKYVQVAQMTIMLHFLFLT